MNTQNQIKRTLEQPAAIETIRVTLESQEIETRTQLADRLCEHFDLRDPRGQLQRAGCLRALRELERAGHFELPATRVRAWFKAREPRRLSAPVPAPQGVPAQAQDVRGLELVVVETEEHMRIWNELMLREHPRGAGPLVGRQLRYLIASEHGWLGGLGICFGGVAAESAGTVDRLGRADARCASAPGGGDEPFSDPPRGAVP
jgi:hypothetical protein